MSNPTISQIKLPSGNIYDIKDATAREAIAALEGGSYFLGVTTTAIIDGSTTNPITIDGQSVTAKNGNMVVYGSGEFVWSGESATGHWVEFGDLSTLGALAYKDTVSLNKGSGDVVLGEATTFTNASSSVSFAAHSTDKVLGSDATFSTTVTPTTTNIKATASGTAVSTTASDSFVKSYPGTTSKMATTTVPNVTGNTNVSIPNVTGNTSVTANKSTWAFAMGSGNDAETLIISGGNGSDVTATNTTLGTALSASKVTLGTAITCATGSLDANGGGASVMTGLGTPTTGTAIGSVSVSTQPTIALSTGATAGTGVISVATGITSATTTTNSKDEVTAITGLGAATAAAQTITVGTNDKVTVAKHGDLSVTVS